MASVQEVTTTWSMSGSFPCIPSYTMTLSFGNPALTASDNCAFYAGSAFLGSLLELDGAVGKMDIANRWTVQPVPSPTVGVAWLHADCTNLLKAGCYLTIDGQRPTYSKRSDGLHWVFATPSAERLGPLGSSGASFDTASVATSPDGRYVVAAAVDGSGVLWFDRLAGEVRKLISWPAADVGQVRNAAVSISPTGRYVAVGAGFPGNDGMTIIDTATCPAMTSATGPACPSTATAPLSQVAGLPASADTSRPLQVKFINDGTLMFTARIGALLGQSSDTTRHNFRMRANATGVATGNSLFVMGDSFTAGEGDAGHYRDGTDVYQISGDALNLCHQSARAWPNVLAPLVHAAPFITAACSGATTSDLFTDTQWPLDNTHSSPFPGVAPQVTGIRRTFAPDTLLVQIGGNDAMFAEIIQRCVKPPPLSPLECADDAHQRRWATQVQGMFSLVRQSLRRLDNEFPEARIVLVGYPSVVDPDGGCGVGVRLSQAERLFADELARYIAQTMQAAAYSAGVQYISLLHSIDDHRLCDPEPWVNGAIAGNDISVFDTDVPILGARIFGNESFHPNADAHHEFAARIAEVLPTLPKSPCATVTCDKAAKAPQPDFLTPLTPADPANWQPQVTQTGSTFTISAGGLQPAAQATGVIHSTPVAIAPGTVGADGSLVLDVTVPGGLEPGWHTLDLQTTSGDGRSLSSTIPFVVPGQGDRDGDGIPDTEDLCPTLPGDQADTTDSDGDGIGDPCDPQLSPPPVPDAPNLVTGDASNSGAFTLAWQASPAATSFTLQHRHPGDEWAEVAAHITNTSYAFAVANPEGEGTWDYRVSATGLGGDSDPSSASTDPVKVDRSGPSQPTASAERAPEDAAGGWFKDIVSVRLGGSSDPALPDGSPGVGGVTYDPPQVFDSIGSHSAAGRAYDALGNSSPLSDELQVKVDTGAPGIAFTDCPAVTVDQDEVVSVQLSAGDPAPGSGLADDPSGSVRLDTATEGSHTLTRSASDRVGHSSSASCSYTVQSAKPTPPGTPEQSGANPNRGGFALGWSASRNATNYRLEHRHQLGDWEAVAVTPAAGYSFSSDGNPGEQEGTWEYRVSAAGPGGSSAPSNPSASVVVDRSAPAAPTADADRAPDYAGAGGWYRDAVFVSFASHGDPRLADGSAGSGVDEATVPPGVSVTGTTTLGGTVKDQAGNESALGSLTVQVDTSAPALTITCPSVVLLHAAASAVINASDTGSGLASDPSGDAPVDTATPGVKLTQRTAVDQVGHSTNRSCVTLVQYMFSGLTQPVNPDGSSIFKLGSTVPLKFRLTDIRSAPISGAVATVSLANVSNVIEGTYLEAVSTSNADSGNQFRESTPGSYTFNLSTKGLAKGTWSVKLTFDDDGSYKTLVSLK